jgi:ATP-binding cassette, subfamily C, bacterial
MATTTILVVGGFRIIDGNLSIGMLIAYQSLTQSFLAPVGSLLSFGSTLQDLEADLNRLDDVLQNPVDPAVTREPSPTTALQAADTIRLKGTVELRHLTFGYNRSSGSANCFDRWKWFGKVNDREISHRLIRTVAG